MYRYIFRVFSIHLTILLLYVGLTSYEFVATNPPNPIGVGIQQWLLMLTHLAITILLFSFLRSRTADKLEIKNRMRINIAVLVSLFILFVCLSGMLSKWLWSLRDGVIQTII